MYRYSVDQSIIYTSQDIVLYRESPFACWMERLTLENPEHGVPPDVGSSPPAEVLEPQDELAATLQDEGKDVMLIEWQADEAARRIATLAAMRHGVDFIINGQLAVGPLSGSANLLMRTSGYSELGNYLYIPCDTQLKTTLGSAFRLCFLADLLHSLQGQLPPQMLILRSNSDVVPLQTEDHIYHYRAVKQRFMSDQQAFKKHSMPDPVEAAHFGRWSDCANEVLKQRALGQPETPALPVAVEEPDKVAATAVASSSAYDMDAVAEPEFTPENDSAERHSTGTLAEQARMLEPQAVPSDSPGHLQYLAFIGSSTTPPTIGEAAGSPAAESLAARQFREAPPASLRNPAQVDFDVTPKPTPDQSGEIEKKPTAPFSNSLITNRDAEES